MKNVVLIILGFCSQFLLFSQQYIPFPDADAVWNVILTEWQPVDSSFKFFSITGDTTYNSLQYHKIYRFEDSTFNNIIRYYGAYRETDDRKIYLIDCDLFSITDSVEVVLYDFSKTVGDTCFVGLNGTDPFGIYYIIDHVDSLLIENNYRKTFHFLSHQDFWIEGIGSSDGLLYPVTWGFGLMFWDLVCFKQNDEVIYLNPDYGTCFPLLVSTEDQHAMNSPISNLYPNPVIDISTIEITDPGNNFSKLEIYNLTGACVKSINITGKEKIMIFRKDFSPGMYMFRVVGDKTCYHWNKFIVN
jgi:hypothetical protein